MALTLIHCGADVKLADKQERMPLHIAAGNNFRAVDFADRLGQLPLTKAILRTDRDIQPHDTSELQILLKQGPNTVTVATEHKKRTAIHEAAIRGYRLDLELLLAAMASNGPADTFPIFDYKNRTLWYYAANHGHIDAVKLLLRLDPSAARHINHVPRDLELPTFFWTMADSKAPSALKRVTALLNPGANPNIRKPEDGCTVLHYAVLESNTPLLTTLLLSHPTTDPHLPDSEGYLPTATSRPSNPSSPILLSLLHQDSIGSSINLSKLNAGGCSTCSAHTELTLQVDF